MRGNKDILIEKKRIWLSFIPSVVLLALFWLAFLVDYSGATGFDMFRLGILPRHLNGLVGIIFSPFIHSSFSHLLSNSFPVLILVWCLFYFYNQIALKTLFFLWLISGFLTWIIGRESYHIGASGLIFSLVFFLFFSGIFRRFIPLIAVSLVVAFAYGSTVWSIFPFAAYVDADISWEGHLSGTIAGLVMAIIFRKEGPQKPEKVWDDESEDDNTEMTGDLEARKGGDLEMRREGDLETRREDNLENGVEESSL